MTIFSWITVILWCVLMVFWLVSAFSAKKSSRPKLWLRSVWFRVVLVVIIFIVIRAGVFSSPSPNSAGQFLWAAPSNNILLNILGVILGVAGVAFAIWARVYLGRNWGMPMTLQEGHELVTSGPYALVRHPIYTGFLLAMLGSAFTDGFVWLIFFVIFGLYFTYSAKTEEKIMAEQFPNEYPAYMKRTKMLIPFIL